VWLVRRRKRKKRAALAAASKSTVVPEQVEKVAQLDEVPVEVQNESNQE
jgi:hypothetical protein